MEKAITIAIRKICTGLRYYAWTICVILLLSAAVIAGHLLPGLDNSEIDNGIRNALHILAFAFFAVIIFESIRQSGFAGAIVLTLLITSIVAGLSEFLQFSNGKRFDLYDLARDQLGVVLALASRFLWQYSGRYRASTVSRHAFRAFSFALGLMIILPLSYWLSIIVRSNLAAPTILGFDNRWEKHLYHPINTVVTAPVSRVDWPKSAGGAAALRLSGRGRSGLGISPVVSNWVGYEFLTFIAAMDNGPDTNVTVRINDGDHVNNCSDLFMASVVVSNRPTLFRIPLREMVTEPRLRTMDLSDIQEIVIFARDERAGTVLLLDEIRLE